MEVIQQGIRTVDHIGETLGKLDRFLFHDLLVFDDVNGDVMVDVAKHIQIHHIETTLDLQDILSSHLVAAGIFDDGNLAVQLV